MSRFSTKELRVAAEKISNACDDAQQFLCDADGKLGDGDLGLTMQKGWKQISEDAVNWDDSIAKNFFQASKSLQSACASSYGTLQATGFMAAAKYCKEKKLEAVSPSDIHPLLTEAYQAMMLRGKGELGQKSVLDILHNLSMAFEGVDEQADLKAIAQQSVSMTLDEFRDRPNLLGRARMFPEKSIGLDDPGMLAIKVVVDAL
ncbi:dihydroxyacetone kinase subunit L [Vibrio sp. JC009]|uniref:DAK2 domain-containing protein n=1 Tax=Vibrio sp. JC009 TaxID=2912314 RepID=UPI0023B0FF6B|nr:DAK2 domain-containing protein [Vibrio sp. JC009]WED24033.1 dihydroxyacetone kinase subunit L [Vibrio sp. JC009]